MNPEMLKDRVKYYWNKASCGTEFIQQTKFSPTYFKHIEEFRYTIEPEIFSFAQFTRFNRKTILEVGVGAGTDFIQWIRAGTNAYGIDLTREAIENVSRRLQLSGLSPQDLRVADAENLPYPDNFFDLVYSWGVIHHSPDTIKCLEEIIRVTAPGGTIKVMVYNRHSLFAVYRWILMALLKGRPFRSLSYVIYHHQESIGTKAYTRTEIKKILQDYPVAVESLESPVTKHDLLYYKAKPFRWLAYAAACVFGWQRAGWFMMIQLRKNQ